MGKEGLRLMKVLESVLRVVLFACIPLIFCGASCCKLHGRDTVHELILEGSACNNHFLYEDAIQYLSEAIKIRSTEKEAYKERAFSYFELNEIDLALKDYSKALYPSPPYKFKRMGCLVYGSARVNQESSSLDFAKGLLHGVFLGSQEETIEFVASIRGGLSFLWAFVCSPVDVSKEVIEAVYAMGEFLAYAKIYDILEAVLPELVECRECWDSWPEYTKGHKMGYIIGKYSIAAFYYVTAWKGVAYYNQLRRANIMATLERFSVAKGAKILQESSQLASKNTILLKKASKGSVVPHNPNVAPHVMQKKHGWDKYVRLSGNRFQDFQKVTAFLEEIEILKCERKLDFAFENVQTYFYRKNMGKDTIVAMFDVNKKGLPLLKSAWVEPNPPHIR